MNTIENGTSDSHSNSRYVIFKRLFLLGYGMNIVLWFVPAVRMKVGGFGGETTVLSMFSVVRMISNVSPGWTAFLVVVFASNIVFIVLALKYPRRWVFLTASSVAAFFVLEGAKVLSMGFYMGRRPATVDAVAYDGSISRSYFDCSNFSFSPLITAFEASHRESR